MKILIGLILAASVAIALPLAQATVNNEMQERIAAYHQLDPLAPMDIRWSRCSFCHE